METLYLTLLTAGAALFGLTLFYSDVELGGWLTLRAVLLFCVGFGLTGILATQAHSSSLTASVAGLLVGVGLSFVGWKIDLWRTAQSGVATRVANLVGREGVITVPIVNNGVGQVAVPDENGAVSYMSARGRGPRGFGEHVKVIACIGHEVFVD